MKKACLRHSLWSGAERGQMLFAAKAQCATCHVPPIFPEPGWNMHTPAEIGIDDFQANRSPDKRYRTTPLKASSRESKAASITTAASPCSPTWSTITTVISAPR